MAKKQVKPLKKLSTRDVQFFRIANRKGYATICKNHLTEGRTVYQAYSRLVKACKRSGFELPIKSAPQLPACKK
jgi:hypothetical protein